MRIKLLILIIMTMVSSQSQAQESVEYRIGKEKLVFSRDFSTGTTISDNCFKDDKLNCNASNFLKTASLKKLAGLHGDPGANICVSELHAELIMGLDENDIESSLCRFKDGSLVTTGSLYFHAMRNDKL